MAQKKKPQSAGSDRQAKIQAAASSGAGSGANKIVIAAVAAVVAIVAVVGFVVIKQVQSTMRSRGRPSRAGRRRWVVAHPAYQGRHGEGGAPTVEAFEDFQCPGCQQFERAIGSTPVDLAKSGDIVLRHHAQLPRPAAGNTSLPRRATVPTAYRRAGPGKFEWGPHDRLCERARAGGHRADQAQPRTTPSRPVHR